MHRRMQTQVWASLIGVVLGGGLSYLAQLTAGRLAARSEDKRQNVQLAEARRIERLAALRDFIQITQEAVRHAEARYDAADWESGCPPEWLTAARAFIDRMLISKRVILILFGPTLDDLAGDYFAAVDHVFWEDLGSYDRVNEHLRGPQNAFLKAAHNALNEPGIEQT
jgi:hypothetical protein